MGLGATCSLIGKMAYQRAEQHDRTGAQNDCHEGVKRIRPTGYSVRPKSGFRKRQPEDQQRPNDDGNNGMRIPGLSRNQAEKKQPEHAAGEDALEVPTRRLARS